MDSHKKPFSSKEWNYQKWGETLGKQFKWIKHVINIKRGGNERMVRLRGWQCVMWERLKLTIVGDESLTIQWPTSNWEGVTYFLSSIRESERNLSKIFTPATTYIPIHTYPFTKIPTPHITHWHHYIHTHTYITT